jgi:hypothetical protein
LNVRPLAFDPTGGVDFSSVVADAADAWPNVGMRARAPFVLDPSDRAAELLDGWNAASEQMGPFTGQTRAILVPTNPPGLPPVELTSTYVPDVPLPFQRAAGHVETLGATYMSENDIIEADLFHNNPNGTCGNCDFYTPRFLDEGDRLTVVPPPGANPPTPRWVGQPRTYVGKPEGIP